MKQLKVIEFEFDGHPLQPLFNWVCSDKVEEYLHAPDPPTEDVHNRVHAVLKPLFL